MKHDGGSTAGVLFDLLRDDLDKLARVASPGAARTVKLQEGERRFVAILFLDIKGFTNLSETLDPEEVHLIIDYCFKIFTKVIEKYGGYIDKYIGDCIMALFGCQVASEKDTERAIRTALELFEKLEGINCILDQRKIKLQMRVGINTGLVVTGPIGKGREGDFTGMGDAVNLASRLESQAPVGGILISENSKKQAGNVFLYKDIDKIQVKGKSEPVSVFLVDSLNPEDSQRWQRTQLVKTSRFVGRKNEINQIQEAFYKAQIPGNKHQVISITGSAGIGKSRLVKEFVEQNLEEALIFKGETGAYVKNPYEVFASLLKHCARLELSCSADHHEFDENLTELTQYLEPISQNKFKDSFPFLKFIAGVTPLDERIEKLDPKSLHTEIKIALKYLLEALSQKANKLYQNPLLILFEDMENCDEASREALSFIIENSSTPLPLLFLILFRTGEFVFTEIRKEFADFEEIKLEPLEPEASWVLVESMLPNLKIKIQDKNFILDKTGCNPFFLEELILTLLEQEIINPENGHWIVKEDLSQISLPDTITGIVLHRLDLLEAECREIIKLAAVIGREFLITIINYLWQKVYPDRDSAEPNLVRLTAQNIILRRRLVGGLGYMFKHLLTQEVAYSIILNCNKKILHGLVAEAIEKKFSESIETFYAVLAHHWHKAENWSKAAYYYEKAGQNAKISFENKLALEYFQNALTIIKNKLQQAVAPQENEYSDLLYNCFSGSGEIYRLLGKYQESLNCFEEAYKISEKIKDPKKIIISLNEIGYLNLLKGLLKESNSILDQALELSIQHSCSEEQAQTLANLGTVHYYRGEWVKSINQTTKALELWKEASNQGGSTASLSGFADSLNNIAGIISMTPEVLDNYQESQQIIDMITNRLSESRASSEIENELFAIALNCFQLAKKVYQEIQNKQNIAITTNNIGYIYLLEVFYQQSRSHFEEALAISSEIGAIRGKGNTLVNIGLLCLDQGLFGEALEKFQEALNLFQQISLSWGMGITLMHLANLYTSLKVWNKAEQAIKESISKFEEINAQEIPRAYAELCSIQIAQGKFLEASENIKFVEEKMKGKKWREVFIIDRLNRAKVALHSTVAPQANEIIEAEKFALDAAEYAKSKILRRLPLCQIVLLEILIKKIELVDSTNIKNELVKQAHELANQIIEFTKQKGMLYFQWQANLLLYQITKDDKILANAQDLLNQLRKRIPPEYVQDFNSSV